MNARRLVSLILPWSLVLLTPLLAQEAPEASPVEVYEVPDEHASPRATMRTFLEAFDPARRDPDADPLAVAAACLDLSEIRPSLRSHQGTELAIQLKEILDRTELIDLEAISDDSRAAPYRLRVAGRGEVVLAPDERGEWLFTTETLAVIPRLLAAVRDRAVVEGVTAVAPLTPAMWLRSKMPGSLLEMGFLLEHWQWLALLTLLVAGLILKRLLTALLQAIVAGRWRHWSPDRIPPERLQKDLRPAGLFAAALFWWAGIYWLGLPAKTLEVLLVAVQFIAAVSFVWTAYRLADVVAAVLEGRARQTGSTFDDLLVPLVRKTLKILVIAFGMVFIADTLQLPYRSILAGLGIGGLAIALAAQDAVKNLFGSLVVIMDRPFSVGDYVVVGSTEGTVEELGFRSTRLRTPQNSLVTLPNSNLINTSVDNLGARHYRRWKTTLGLTYDTPPATIEAFCEGVRELIREHPHTRKEAYYVYFREFSASSLDVLLQLFFDVPDWQTELEARQQLGLDILRLAERMGVELAFPTQTVHVHGATPGSPTEARQPVQPTS